MQHYMNIRDVMKLVKIHIGRMQISASNSNANLNATLKAKNWKYVPHKLSEPKMHFIMLTAFVRNQGPIVVARNNLFVIVTEAICFMHMKSVLEPTFPQMCI